MHDLQVERVYKTQTHNGLVATKQGPIKTFPLRGIKDSPPYLHDGRLLTLEDTVEFFNLILELKLTADEKKDLVAFLRCLWGRPPRLAASRRRGRGERRTLGLAAKRSLKRQGCAT